MLFLPEHFKQQDSITADLEGTGLQDSAVQMNGSLLIVPM